MRELARLLYLIVVIVPLTILVLGPLLALAAVRGMQRLGPIVFNPARRGTAGRIGALVLGLLVWLAVWGGLAMVVSRAALPTLSRAQLPGLQAYLSPTLPPASAQPGSETPTLALIATPEPTIRQAPSPTPRIEAPTPSPSPSSTPMPPSPTSTRPAASAPVPDPVPASGIGKGPRGTPTPTMSIGSPARTALPTVAGRAASLETATPPPSPPAPQPSTAAPSPTLAATLSLAQVEEAISAVETANELLRAAVAEASSGNLAALEGRWQGRALTRAQAFAQDLYERYRHPLQVTFEYLRPPSMQQGASTARAVVTSTEVWIYAGPNSAHTESFEFIYTLSQQGEGWVITEYTYRNAPAFQPSATPGISSPITATTTLAATTAITPTAP